MTDLLPGDPPPSQPPGRGPSRDRETRQAPQGPGGWPADAQDGRHNGQHGGGQAVGYRGPGQPPRPGAINRIRDRRDAWPTEWWDEVPVQRAPWLRTPKALLVLLIVFGGFALGCWRVYSWGVEQVDPPGDPGEVVVLALGDGDTASNIADTLEENGIIPDANFYRWYVRLRGAPGFQAGEYEFQENSAAWEVKDVLAGGPARVAQAVTVPVGFPEGLTVDEIVRRVDLNVEVPYTGAQFAAALRSPALYRSFLAPDAANLPEGAEPLEGLLFPDTYFVQEGEDPRLLVERMLRQMETVARNAGIEQSRDVIGLSPYETLIVASLIEKEAGTEADRPKIARVILNRIERGWTLGIDATVVYITGNNQITGADLEIDSPWNTRRFGGLPPTPIASPGAASIEAALNPDDGDWMYYVRTEDDGGHTFAVTDAEFEAAKQICIEKGFGCG